MPGNVPVLEAAFEYQELYGWYRVLDLLSPAGRVDSVSIEDPDAGHFDDVTLRPRAGTVHAAEFLQVKFHVDLSDWYSADSVVASGLLRKAWRTWQLLRPEFEHIELSLVTTWAWDTSDPIAPHLRDRRLTRMFVDGILTGNAWEARDRWRLDVGAPREDEFRVFLAALRFRTAYDEKTELLERIRDRMALRHLKADDDSLRKGASQVRQWIIDKHVRITRADLDAAIDALGLRAAPDEPSVVLYVHTVRKTPMETGAEYELDWRDAFEGPEREKGHRLLDSDDWNARLLPELEAIADRIASESPARLLRVRGLARLSPWFAVGFTFRETAGWTIETDQYGARWRTDAAPRDEIPDVVPVSNRSGPRDAIAVAVGVTGDPTAHVLHYLDQAGDPAGRLLTVRTPRLGPDAVSSDGELVRLARTLKSELQNLVPRARRVLLFYWGPASAAVFIGHQLNAVASEIQLFEEQDGLYLPSFTLR
jgi:CBASS immunity sensor of nucleotide second messenger signals